MVTTKRANSPAESDAGPQPSQLDLYVIYTDRTATLEALRTAAGLASSLHARIRIVLPAIVPYPLSIDEAPVCASCHCRRLKTVANGLRLETVAEIVYCRDYADLGRAMPRHSIVLIGGRRRWWWPWSRTASVARALRTGGHHILYVTNKELPRG